MLSGPSCGSQIIAALAASSSARSSTAPKCARDLYLIWRVLSLGPLGLAVEVPDDSAAHPLVRLTRASAVEPKAKRKLLRMMSLTLQEPRWQHLVAGSSRTW